MNKKYIPLLTMMFFLAFTARSTFGQREQQKLVKIESIVVDENDKPVKNAVIYGKEGAIEVLSDSEGKFSIEVPQKSKLLIEANGFQKQIFSQSQIASKIKLAKAAFLMDDDNLINVSFGKITKREVVGSLNAVNTKDIIKYDNTQYIYDALRSRVPGLLGNNNIRGIGTAIFVVDGFPRDPSDINLEEVEQITVLKDANASVLWGTQAKNGVIIVTTKRGQAHKRKINVSMEKGMSLPVAFPKYLNSADYFTKYNEALANDGLPAAYADSTIQHYSTGNRYEYPSNDFYSSEYLRNHKPFTKVLTEFSGGNEITQYYATVGWTNSGSLLGVGTGKESSYDRFNIRGNVDFKVNDYIKSFVDALVIIEGDKGPRGSFWSNAATSQPQYFSPLLPLSLISKNVNLTGGADLENIKHINGDYILGGTNQYTNNVYGNMFLGGYTQSIRRTARFNTGIDFDLKGITQGLKLKTFVSLDVYNAYTESVENTYAVYQPTWSSFGASDSITSLNKIGIDAKTGVQNLGDGGYTRRFGSYALLDYARTFNEKHSFAGTLLGYFDYLNASAVIIDEKDSHIGLRLNYDYNKRIFVDFSSAYVNGFKLEKGNRGGFSPSLGLAWVIRDERSKQSLTNLNYLKLKASAGIINYETAGDNYRLYESTFSAGSAFGWYDGTRSIPSTIITRAGNPNLTFEKMKTVTVGLEGYALNNLLYLEANVFANRNSGQIIRRSIYAPYIGNNYPYENYNITDYYGGEAGVRISKTVGDFYFDLGANLLYADSKVIKRDELWSNDYQYRQGLSNDAMFGLEALGFFVNDADISNSPSQKFGEVRPGDIKYKDQNNDGKIDADDEVKIGNSGSRLSYGVSFTMKYKNVSLFAVGNGRNGAESLYSGEYFWVQGSDKYSAEVLNSWTPSTAPTATYPRLSTKNSPNNFRNSTFWLYNNNYFMLDRVQLSLDIPKNMSHKIASKDIVLYLRGDNLARISKDAEKRQLRIGGEPNYRSYALGLKILF